MSIVSLIRIAYYIMSILLMSISSPLAVDILEWMAQRISDSYADPICSGNQMSPVPGIESH